MNQIVPTLRSWKNYLKPGGHLVVDHMHRKEAAESIEVFTTKMSIIIYEISAGIQAITLDMITRSTNTIGTEFLLRMPHA